MNNPEMAPAVADLPLMGWTTHLHPKFADKSLAEARGDVMYRIQRAALRVIAPKGKTIDQIMEEDAPHLEQMAAILNEFDAPETTLVQIGAHNGSFDDPFAGRISNGWHAVLVEPQQRQYAQLSSRYADNDNVQCVRTAISDDPLETSLTLWRAASTARGSFGSAIASTNPDQVRSEIRRCATPLALRKPKLVSETVPVMTLDGLFNLTNTDPSKVDIFATDTEGFDGKIIRSLVQNGVRPPVIQWEHLHVDPQMIAEVDSNLKELNYQTIRTHKDTLAYSV